MKRTNTSWIPGFVAVGAALALNAPGTALGIDTELDETIPIGDNTGDTSDGLPQVTGTAATMDLNTGPMMDADDLMDVDGDQPTNGTSTDPSTWTAQPIPFDGAGSPPPPDDMTPHIMSTKANIFIFGDSMVPSGFSNEVWSFGHDRIVYDRNDHSNGILPQYIADRAAGASTVTAYAGLDDIATLWEGRSLGSINLVSEAVSVDGMVYFVSGTLTTSTLWVDEDGVRAEFYPEENAQCELEGVTLDFTLPIQEFEVSSSSLTITTMPRMDGSSGPTTTKVMVSGFPATYTVRASYLLDYGTGAPNQLTYLDHAVMGLCAADPDVTIAVSAGGIAPSTVKFILQKILCTSGSGQFAQAIEDDTLTMLLETQDGFGRYFTDSILRWNPLTSSGVTVSYPEIRYHEVEDADVAELVMSVNMPLERPSDSLYLSEAWVEGTSSNLSGSEGMLENVLRNLIPGLLTGGSGEGGTASTADGCTATAGTDGVTVHCDCEEDSDLSECEVSMTIGYPTYVWAYEDGSGVDRAFEVTFDWDSGAMCETPIREVRAQNLAFHVKLSDIEFHGKKYGIGFNIEGSGGFTVQGLALAMDFDTLAQRGNPDQYDCMNRFGYCLGHVSDLDDSEALVDCVLDSDGSEGGPSGSGCSFDFFAAMNAFSLAVTEEELDDAVERFEDAVERSTFRYRDSYLDLTDAELSMHLSLSESNLIFTESDLEELAYELFDMISERVEDNLLEMASTDDLLGPQGVILERVYGYRTARDLTNTAGMSWSSSFQVGVMDLGSWPEWHLIARHREP